MSANKSLKLTAYFFAFFVLGCQESDQTESNIEKSKPEETILPNNAFDYFFNGTTINYEYREDEQTHDYSENWDFDGDGLNDSIQFVGNGGAHLYFTPVIKLSSNSKEQTFEWLSTDDPLLQPADSLNKNARWFSLVNFVVHDFNNDQLDDIFIQIDHTNLLPAKFNHVKPDNRRFVLCFDKKTKKLVAEEWATFSEE